MAMHTHTHLSVFSCRLSLKKYLCDQRSRNCNQMGASGWGRELPSLIYSLCLYLHIYISVWSDLILKGSCVLWIFREYYIILYPFYNTLKPLEYQRPKYQRILCVCVCVWYHFSVWSSSLVWNWFFLGNLLCSHLDCFWQQCLHI